MLRLVAIRDDFASVHDAIACFWDLAHFFIFTFNDKLINKFLLGDILNFYEFIREGLLTR